MNEYDTSTSDALAANESLIARLEADLTRAETLLTNAGIGFQRTANPAQPWVRPQDNRDALVIRAALEAKIAYEMDQMCGPAAFHRNAKRQQADEMLVVKNPPADEDGDVGC